MADGQGYGGYQGYGGGNHQAEQLKAFWQSQLVEVSEIMKSDEDVRMISAEAPVLFAKACEMFILELTLRSWMHAEENKRRTLQRNDVAAAIFKTEIFDFLMDIVPRDDVKEEGQPAAASAAAAAPPAAASAAPQAPVPAASRPPAGLPSHPALGPGGLFFPSPYGLPPGALGGDPNHAAAAAAAAAMMRPPMPMGVMDPALMSLYQQQLMAGQAWTHLPGLPPPPTASGAGDGAAGQQGGQGQSAGTPGAAQGQAGDSASEK
ncbi:hypothetical protein GPECTOR_96g735 [Gonium pectorale]|uniref:Core Histone H2A/H2B/H3 domain-containing protein n=1 Tax=Gonium pectorale TaxID=33097 RepID=A0A150G092_GONPE|nr:hypothetical protein GPECTOR_96g735 [Gonium pectorale]|eukprot:KXZ43269.1 hypothetical protein GPECTOR_96g735 [Gonium pectorale]